jgi:hypothetical protein
MPEASHEVRLTISEPPVEREAGENLSGEPQAQCNDRHPQKKSGHDKVLVTVSLQALILPSPEGREGKRLIRISPLP